MSKVFVTSDSHFNHARIIQYCNRPFQDVSEMNEKLIENWNSVVSKDDVVYHLGDFHLGSYQNVQYFMDRLNFKFLHLVKGNHDKSFCEWYKRNKPQTCELHDSYLETKIEGHNFTLCHYAMRVFNKSHHGAYHLYGHSHGTLPDDSNSLSFDVGVDCHNYTPVSLEQVREIMSQKKFKLVDKHKVIDND